VNIIKQDSYVILEMNNDSSWNTLSNFLTNNNVMSSVIINLLKSDLDTDEVVLKLLPFHLNWEKRNKTFILVSNIGRNISKQLVLIKTLEEAIDFFHMEQLTRNI
tara:strand:- start:123 stop:437 length:315 start_codon:yes stop_codon:yes gene_type:complete